MGNESLIQECATCGALIDVSNAEPFALMHCPTCGAAMRVRRRFDHFEIQEIMGTGGMGTVYRALDTRLHRPVALKLLQPQLSDDAEIVAQFQREAAITASINHPHVVKVYSTGIDNGLVYLAMELVDHGSLHDMLNAAGGKLPEIEVLEIGIQIAKGLDAALARGLIHRDIKPGNILFSSDRKAKIVDFGLAVLAAHGGGAQDQVWGTPAYVAPESLDGRFEDFRTDMYALGATLFQALSGRFPHATDTDSMSELLKIKRQPVSVKKATPTASDATASVLEKMLRFEPADRCESYAEVIERLESARSQLLSQNTDEEDAQPARNSDWLTFVVIGVVVITGVVVFGLVERARRPATPAEVSTGIANVDEQYESARQQLIAGDVEKAAAIFRELDSRLDTPQPQRNWITLHAGLAELLGGDIEHARAHFVAVEKRGIYSTDPAEQKLARFFVETSRAALSDTPVTESAAKDFDLSTGEAFGLLVFAAQNWSLENYEHADVFLRRFLSATPAGRHAWVAQYQPFAKTWSAEVSAARSASTAAMAAASPAALKQALADVQSTAAGLKMRSKLPEQLAQIEKELQQKIAAAEQDAANRSAAVDAADAKLLAEMNVKRTALEQQFRFREAWVAAKNVTVQGVKARAEREKIVKKAEWLIRFKSTLIADLTALGYAEPLTKKSGAKLPAGARRADDVQVDIVTPFGSLPVPWNELTSDSIYAMAQSFLRPNLPPAALADRQWYLGVYALSLGKAREGRTLLIEASQAKEEYRNQLSVCLETANAP